MRRILSILVLALIISCSSKEEGFVDPDLISPSPISEIQEKIDASPEEAFSHLRDALEGEGFSVNSADYINGFETGSISIQDKICNSTYSEQTPVPCRVRFYVKILPEDSISRIVLKYVETCMDQEHLKVTCKDSKGEDYLFKIHRRISSN